MTTPNNKEKNENFYTLLKEMLGTQETIIKNQEYIMSSLDRMQEEGKKKSSCSDVWGSI